MQTAIAHKSMFSFKFLTTLSNIKFVAAAALLDLSGVWGFITKYIFEDITYLKFLIVACGIDLITGVTKVWVNEGRKAVTSRGLRDTVSKAIQYGSFLIITHVLTHFQINGQANTDFVWINKVAFEFLILVEIKSVYENIVRINKKLDFIEGVMQKYVDKIKSKNDDTNKPA